MTLAITGLALAMLAGVFVWFACNRIWHILIIAALSALLFPLVAIHLTGDLSRYFPPETFSVGAAGKDQVVLASVAATILVAIILAACAWAAAQMAWRRLRRRTS